MSEYIILYEPDAILARNRYVENKTKHSFALLYTALKSGIFYSFKVVLCYDSTLKYILNKLYV